MCEEKSQPPKRRSRVGLRRILSSTFFFSSSSSKSKRKFLSLNSVSLSLFLSLTFSIYPTFSTTAASHTLKSHKRPQGAKGLLSLLWFLKRFHRGISRLAVGENKPFLIYLLSHRNLLTINHRVVSELSAVATFPREKRGKRGKFYKEGRGEFGA